MLLIPLGAEDPAIIKPIKINTNDKKMTPDCSEDQKIYKPSFFVSFRKFLALPDIKLMSPIISISQSNPIAPSYSAIFR